MWLRGSELALQSNGTGSSPGSTSHVTFESVVTDVVLTPKLTINSNLILILINKSSSSINKSSSSS